MASIAGVYQVDGAPVARGVLQRLAGAIAYRAADGVDVWQQGSVGLVHGHFWTTPEEVGERQPISAADGRFWVTADARIDNRDELMDGLRGGGDLTQKTPTDAELILAAYARWGEGCAERLVGDFAFALWDAAARRLFLARDLIGIRQLYYVQVDGAFYFATTVGALLAVLPSTPALNRPLIDAYLRGNWSLWVCQTVYQGILRLPPAHALSVVPERSATPRLFYVLGSQPPPAYGSDEAWFAAFRDVLNTAIRARLRSREPVGLLLGGLDSSAIACAAHELVRAEPGLPAVRLYTSVYRDLPSADDSPYSAAVAERCPAFTYTRIESDDCWAFREYSERQLACDEPVISPLRCLNLHQFRTIAADGARVALHGDGGDGILGRFLYHDPVAIRGLPWREWFGQRRQLWAHGRFGLVGLLLRAYLAPAVPAPVWHFKRSLLQRVGRWEPAWLADLGYGPYRVTCRLDRRFHDPRGLPPAAAVIHRQLRHPYDIARQSDHDFVAGLAGLELRAPLFDRRLLEFMLGNLPPHLRTWRGADRVMAREGLRAILPETVRQRFSKATGEGLVQRGLRHRERALIERLLAGSSAQRLGVFDAAALRAAVVDYWQERTNNAAQVSKALHLEAWLRMQWTPHPSAGADPTLTP